MEQAKLKANAAAPLPPAGGYISKRRRLAVASDDSAVLSESLINLPFTGAKDILSSQLPHHIKETLKNIEPHAARFNRIPKSPTWEIQGHTKGINSIQWSPTNGVRLESLELPDQSLARRLSSHVGAVKDVQWSIDGKVLLSCGYEKKARLTDVESASELQVFTDDQYLNTVRFHPLERNVFLTGGTKGILKTWDIRSGKAVKEYSKNLGQILDVDFNKDGRRFVSSADIAKRNCSDRAIIVWDYEKQIALSNQVYLEAYTCPAIRFHPFEETFIAQSNASYIAIFSARPPYKMNKFKRFEGHEVSANRIQCNFSPDGALVATGSADGSVFIYSFRSSSILKTFQSHEHVCTDVSFHPVLPSVVASCSWDGRICVYE